MQGRPRRRATYRAAVGHTYDTLTVLQREKIWELKERRISGAKIAELLAVGFPREDPPIPKVKVSAQAVNTVYRRLKLERDQLYYTRMAHVPTESILALNRRKLSQIAAAELERLRLAQERGKLDGEQLRKMARACEAIEGMEVRAAKRDAVADPDPKRRGEKGDQEAEQKAPSFTDTLAAEAEARERELAEQSQGDADQDDADPEAVPNHLTGIGHSTTPEAPALPR